MDDIRRLNSKGYNSRNAETKFKRNYTENNPNVLIFFTRILLTVVLMNLWESETEILLQDNSFAQPLP